MRAVRRTPKTVREFANLTLAALADRSSWCKYSTRKALLNGRVQRCALGHAMFIANGSGDRFGLLVYKLSQRALKFGGLTWANDAKGLDGAREVVAAVAVGAL